MNQTSKAVSGWDSLSVGYGMRSVNCKRLVIGLLLMCLSPLLVSCANKDTSPPPSVPDTVPERYLIDCDVVYLAGVSNEDLYRWGAEQFESIDRCNERLALAREARAKHGATGQ